ncbi:hypothetical protein M6B38_404370 [Iris pallida]|uniref:Uncharacterized protein n=1 Tax=Iris pallida TaxID=29817 RepID=A0AAX6FRT0_IRIPA|nr:hypothetical protein M6B38_404370 [Iris pallida]
MTALDIVMSSRRSSRRSLRHRFGGSALDYNPAVEIQPPSNLATAEVPASTLRLDS